MKKHDSTFVRRNSRMGKRPKGWYFNTLVGIIKKQKRNAAAMSFDYLADFDGT